MKSTSTQVDINQGTSCSRHCKKIFLIFQKLSLVCLISASARHKGRKFTTIAKNQWFLRWPLPLMEWYLLNHWDQWFFNGFQSANHWLRCFSMVANHWSNDTMVTIHRFGLQRPNTHPFTLVVSKVLKHPKRATSLIFVSKIRSRVLHNLPCSRNRPRNCS